MIYIRLCFLCLFLSSANKKVDIVKLQEASLKFISIFISSGKFANCERYKAGELDIVYFQDYDSYISTRDIDYINNLLISKSSSIKPYYNIKDSLSKRIIFSGVTSYKDYTDKESIKDEIFVGVFRPTLHLDNYIVKAVIYSKSSRYTSDIFIIFDQKYNITMYKIGNYVE